MKALMIAIGLSVTLMGSQYTLIVSKKSDLGTLSMQQVKEIFLQKRHTVGSQRVIPLNLLGQHESRGLFEFTVLGMDREHLNNYWVKKHYEGVSPPLTQGSFESIKVFVQTVEGSIGYVPSSMVDKTVKAVYEF
ncbi:MAG: hypothetical protein Q8S36_00100 [Sulfuricurvum sp.]|nr:hypothetical protein [Sulfuricurvum sp.]